MYKFIRKTDGTILEGFVFRISDMAQIPLSEDNRDYQEYLKWVAEGNTPDPADQGE